MSISWQVQDLFVSSVEGSIVDGEAIIEQRYPLKVGRIPAARGIRELLIRKGVGEKIGITIRRIEEEKLFIYAVAQRSPAYLAGLRFGDEILCLDGDTSPGGDLNRVRELLEKNVRNSIRLHTKDRSDERYVTITRDAQRGYGFRFVNGEITFVRPNTSAQRCGLERKLQIVEVNGEVVAGMNDTDIEAVICANMSTVTLCVVPTKVYRNLLARNIVYIANRYNK
ncbi:syntenin-2-like [Anopheles ziemanni]|uniref:syntenin-2-like n=1 Tax=Anopheles coustani TaxID=139045 RepID=UPI002657C114|nr:syntenin-2-like [Anopheles coustani]XP_058177459.1 syntenin-2-like [Anopheles ziemanni]